MKHLITRSNFELLFEQAIFSLFNFIIVIHLYHDISKSEVAAMGVNITALYGAISISRNMISGDFTQSKFPQKAINLESVLRIICIRSLVVSPFVLIIILLSSYLTKTDIETTLFLTLISFEVIFVDNFRQIQILYRKLQFMSINLISAISLTYLLIVLLNLEQKLTLKFWLFSFSLYLLIALVRYFKIFGRRSQNRFAIPSLVSRKSITIESFSSHSLFYLYNLVFFQINPLLSGETRLITAWIVNAASSVYITVNNYYTIRLVNSDSTYREQRSINLLAFVTLAVTSLFFLVFEIYSSFSNIKIDFWLIFGTCVSSLAFFIHSRVSILYLHAMTSPRFLALRSLTWTITLALQLVGTYFFGEKGFILGSVFSCVYVMIVYERALASSIIVKRNF